MPRQINTNTCVSCGACISACPVDAIENKDNFVQINADECVDCETCDRICPVGCIDGAPDKYLELRTK